MKIGLKIVSGGQTGVDRAALDAAITLGMPHGGWCPRGRLAEDGRIADRYQLVEMPTSKYAARTEQNVIDSDATLILFRNRLEGGTALTVRLANRYDRPTFLLDLDEIRRFGINGQPIDVRSSDARSLDLKHPMLNELTDWLDEGQFATLNIAGPRESTMPGIHELAKQLLIHLLSIG